VIRLRHLLERGLAHPILGPLVLIVLAVLLSMVFLHVSEDGHGALGELGAACVALTTVLGSLLLVRRLGLVRSLPRPVPSDRGPPAAILPRAPAPVASSLSARSSPLRR
jgi:hypothetical protein